MTITETSPEATHSVDSTPAPSSPAMTGLAAWLGTADHKKVGRLYIAFSLLFGVVAIVLMLLFSVERIDATSKVILTPNSVSKIFGLHLDAGLFLALLPGWLGVATIIVPLQVGAKSIAFPRAASAAFWLFLVSAGLVIAGYAANGGPTGASNVGRDLYTVGMGTLIIALLIGSVCVAVTAITLRTPGLTIARIPFFSWSAIVTAVALTLTLPVMLANIVLAYISRRYGGVFDGAYGTTFDWVYRQPQIYVVAIPALGLISEIVPVFARARQGMRWVVRFAIGGFAVFALGAWAQSNLNPSVRTGFTFILLSVLIGLPALLAVGGWADTLRRGGKPSLQSPLLFAIAAILLLLPAVLAGVATGIKPFKLVGTTWELGQFKLVVSVSLIAFIAALHYWAPKIWGAPLHEGIARGTAGLVLIGAVLSAGGDLVTGGLHQGYSAVKYSAHTGQVLLNTVAFVGEAILALAGVLVIANIAYSARNRSGGADDHWGGHTLEWATSNPPAASNFTSLPVIASAEPLLDQADALASSAKGA